MVYHVVRYQKFEMMASKPEVEFLAFVLWIATNFLKVSPMFSRMLDSSEVRLTTFRVAYTENSSWRPQSRNENYLNNYICEMKW